MYAMKVISKNLVIFSVIALTTGCQDARLANLEQRVGQLEQNMQRLESARTKTAEDEAARRAKLENCVAEANSAFERNLISNGTKARNGSYNVPVPVLGEMQRQKQGKIDECRLLYSK
jgi:septal ring factor EnvC (AmiA/AmiB activator)